MPTETADSLDLSDGTGGCALFTEGEGVNVPELGGMVLIDSVVEV